ncbi:MAG: hypothetical protein KJ634_05330 [Gammaproteobacteria bacterium]|nr:hypothetical protein [Gammaproteobacteria bacterium]MBU1415026.1 hypothetical protein [Gammaproteobacteria bacterium]
MTMLVLILFVIGLAVVVYSRTQTGKVVGSVCIGVAVFIVAIGVKRYVEREGEESAAQAHEREVAFSQEAIRREELRVKRSAETYEPRKTSRTSQCGLIGEYQTGMTMEEVRGVYTKTFSAPPPCEMSPLGDKEGSTCKGQIQLVDGVFINVTFGFHDDKLISMSGIFAQNNFGAVRQAFLERFGTPRTDTNCDEAMLSSADRLTADRYGGCEGLYWNNAEGNVVVLDQVPHADGSQFSVLSGPTGDPARCLRPFTNSASRVPDSKTKRLFDKLSYCVVPAAQYGQYSSYDGGKSAGTILLDKCTNEYLTWKESCLADGGTKDGCLLAGLAYTQTVLRSFNR